LWTSESSGDIRVRAIIKVSRDCSRYSVGADWTQSVLGCIPTQSVGTIGSPER
jgi:hypothetical protein